MRLDGLNRRIARLEQRPAAPADDGPDGEILRELRGTTLEALVLGSFDAGELAPGEVRP